MQTNYPRAAAESKSLFVNMRLHMRLNCHMQLENQFKHAEDFNKTNHNNIVPLPIYDL